MSAATFMLLPLFVATATVAGLPAPHLRQLQAACSGTVTIADSGTISDGAGDYSSNMECYWELSCPSGGTPTLTFSSFSTDPFDRVEIFDTAGYSAFDRTGRLSGSSLPAAQTGTAGQTMYVKWRSDGSTNMAGFDATFSCPGNSPPVSPVSPPKVCSADCGPAGSKAGNPCDTAADCFFDGCTCGAPGAMGAVATEEESDNTLIILIPVVFIVALFMVLAAYCIYRKINAPKKRRRDLGLPETATDAECVAAEHKQRRSKLGLLESATDAECHHVEVRHEYGLKADATEEELSAARATRKLKNEEAKARREEQARERKEEHDRCNREREAARLEAQQKQDEQHRAHLDRMSEIQAQGRSDQQERREEAESKREEKREEAHASKMEHEQEMREEAKMREEKREAAKSGGKFGGTPLQSGDAALHQPDHGEMLVMDEEHRIGTYHVYGRTAYYKSEELTGDFNAVVDLEDCGDGWAMNGRHAWFHGKEVEGWRAGHGCHAIEAGYATDGNNMFYCGKLLSHGFGCGPRILEKFQMLGGGWARLGDGSSGPAEPYFYRGEAKSAEEAHACPQFPKVH